MPDVPEPPNSCIAGYCTLVGGPDLREFETDTTIKTQRLIQAVLILMLDVAAISCGGGDESKTEAGNAAAAGSGSEGTSAKPQPTGANLGSERCVASTMQLFEARSDGYGTHCRRELDETIR